MEKNKKQTAAHSKTRRPEEKTKAAQSSRKKGRSPGNHKNGIIKAVIVIAVILAVIGLAVFIMTRPKPQPEYSASTLLEDVYEISEFSLVSYTYNGVATAYAELPENVEPEPVPKYYVAYKGEVTIGFDFEDCEPVTDEEAKTVTITIPEPKILDLNVNIGEAEFIFANNWYNTESVISEANQVAKADLEAKVKEDKEMMAIAKENAVSVVRAWSEPVITQFMPEYTLIVK